MGLSISMKIKLASKAAGVPIAELARRIGTTPQNLRQRLKVDKFTSEEIEKIAAALGCVFTVVFIFPDGTRI